MPEKNKLFNEGALLYRDGNFKEALLKFEQFLEHISPVNNYPEVVKTLTKIGECQYHLQNYTEALKHFDKACSLAESRQDSHSLAMSQMNLAKVLLNDTPHQGLVQASYYLEEALQRFHQLQDDTGLELVKKLQADLEGQLKKAELNAIFSSLPINLTPNILLRSGSDFKSVIFETIRGEYQLDAPRLNAIIYLLQLIRDKITLEDSPQN
ncbi:MAG: tol-pal system YbgF family protein [Candidatus Hodarchaeota archaeon]